jgi:hypothetical protein
MLLLIVVGPGCSSTLDTNTPQQKYSQVLKIHNKLQEVQRSLEAACLRREGFEAPLAPTERVALSVSQTQFPSKRLLTYTDGDLAQLASVSNPPAVSESLGQLQAARKIDGPMFLGGCQQWSAQKTAALFPFAKAIEAVDQDLENRAKNYEAKERATIDAEWVECLVGETRSLAKSKGYSDPSGIQMAMGQEALVIAAKYGKTPKEARRRLALRVDMERTVFVESRRCAAKTSFFRRFDVLRSSSLAKVLDNDGIASALAFDIDKIKAPKNVLLKQNQ